MWYVIKRTSIGLFSIGLMFGIILGIVGVIYVVMNYAIAGWIVGITTLLLTAYSMGGLGDEFHDPRDPGPG